MVLPKIQIYRLSFICFFFFFFFNDTATTEIYTLSLHDALPILLTGSRKMPDNRVAITMHFLLHGIHHYLPMDKLRLVMPPTLFLALATPFWHLAQIGRAHV